MVREIEPVNRFDREEDGMLYKTVCHGDLVQKYNVCLMVFSSCRYDDGEKRRRRLREILSRLRKREKVTGGALLVRG